MMVERDNECSFCTEGLLEITQKSEYGSLVVLKTGDNLETDWYVTLQPGTPTNPLRGIHCLLMPLGHVPSLLDVNKNRKFSENYGISSARISYAMQIILEEEWNKTENGIFMPNQIVYGKYAPGRNTKPGHIHFRFTDHSGCLAQPYPSDNGWRKKDVFKDEKTGAEYVTADPVRSQKFPLERFEKLGSRLIKLCND